MKQPTVHNKFIFNEKIDAASIFGLYENDYAYIIEVFTGSLETLNEEYSHLTAAFEASDTASLKKTSHKIKPLFGFTGLTYHEDMMARFEHLCSSAANTSGIIIQYMEILDVIKEARTILKEDINRLTEFTS